MALDNREKALVCTDYLIAIENMEAGTSWINSVKKWYFNPFPKGDDKKYPTLPRSLTYFFLSDKGKPV